MTILGINLSSTFQKKKTDGSQAKMLPNQTMLAVIVGKMIVMPLLGITSTWFLQASSYAITRRSMNSAMQHNTTLTSRSLLLIFPTEILYQLS
jgi:hypothetical protein